MSALLLLGETVREGRMRKNLTQARLARLAGVSRRHLGALEKGANVSVSILQRVAQVLELTDIQIGGMAVHAARFPSVSGPLIGDGVAADSVLMETAGEIRHGKAVDETRREKVSVPRSIVDDGEVLFRTRGDVLRDQGIADGDLIVVELRPGGRAATGELVIGRIGEQLFIGRWWQKQGRRALLPNGLSEVTAGDPSHALNVVGAINQIVRGVR